MNSSAEAPTEGTGAQVWGGELQIQGWPRGAGGRDCKESSGGHTVGKNEGTPLTLAMRVSCHCPT